MQIETTHLKDCVIITPLVFGDNRGSFFESFNKKEFKKETGISAEFVQDNQSISNKNVLRGLHLQKGNYAQAKLVRVVQGSVLDVCVDLRPNSPTFRQHFSIELSVTNNKQLFIPRGFAHGFLALENNTIFSYKCDNYYNKQAESGIIYNDVSLNINWNIQEEQILLSAKDKQLPTLEKYLKNDN